jgi:hypothetical protein
VTPEQQAAQVRSELVSLAERYADLVASGDVELKRLDVTERRGTRSELEEGDGGVMLVGGGKGPTSVEVPTGWRYVTIRLAVGPPEALA